MKSSILFMLLLAFVTVMGTFGLECGCPGPCKTNMCCDMRYKANKERPCAGKKFVFRN